MFCQVLHRDMPRFRIVTIATKVESKNIVHVKVEYVVIIG